MNLVSVIIPAYNAGRTVERTVETSCARQCAILMCG